MESGDELVLHIILMINFKRTLKDSTNLNQKSRSKSIYRGDQSHTLSMNLKVDHDLSPDLARNSKDPYLLAHKQSLKENRGQKFRESLKITQTSLSGKKSHRDDISRRSSKKIITSKPLETDRCKQINNLSHRKSVMKHEKSVSVLDRPDSKTTMVTVSQSQLKDILQYMRKLAAENSEMRKEISFIKKDSHKNSVMRALGC